MTSIESRIEVLRPKAGDTLIFSVYGCLSKEQREHIINFARPVMPAGVKVLLLDSRISLTQIVSPEAPAPVEAEPFDFNAWMRDSTEQAHRQHMARTKLLPFQLGEKEFSSLGHRSHGGID